MKPFTTLLCALCTAALFCTERAAAAVPMETAARLLPGCNRVGAALCTKARGWNALVVPTPQGNVGALFLTRANDTPQEVTAQIAGRELAGTLDMMVLRSMKLNETGAALFSDEASTDGHATHLLGLSPLQAIVYLGKCGKRSTYSMGELNSAGGLEMQYGSKKSINIILPLTAETLNAVELVCQDITMDPNSAKGLAGMVGYGAGSGGKEELSSFKKAAAADKVYYLQPRRQLGIVKAGQHYFFGDADGIRALAQAADTELSYPAPAARPEPVTPPPAAVRPLTPAEALQSYIRKLKGM